MSDFVAEQSPSTDFAGVRIGLLNEVLKGLIARRVDRIVPEGPIAKPKIAWKVATYEALLYRVVALASGCAWNWNRDDVLCSALAARALLKPSR